MLRLRAIDADKPRVLVLARRNARRSVRRATERRM